MSYISDTLEARTIQPEEELDIGMQSTRPSPWEELKGENHRRRDGDGPSPGSRWIQRFAGRVDDMEIVETDPSVLKAKMLAKEQTQRAARTKRSR